MKRMNYFIAATLLILLAGCSGSDKNKLLERPAAVLYSSGQDKLQDGNYRVAITELEALDNRYPFGPYSQQVQLDLIYAYYKAGELSMAQAAVDRFLRLNPTNTNVDYVLYLRGVINMSIDESSIQRFFGIQRHDRDPQSLRVAFADFSQLIRNYPNSQYNSDARQRMLFLQNSLANYDLSVAKYYHQRGAFVAVAARVEQMMRYYPDTEATHQALPLMKNAYQQLKINQEAMKVEKIIEANHL